MNSFPSREAVERLRREYPVGTRVELITMDDPYSKLKSGDRGFIMAVDDIGTCHIRWDCGSTLGAAFGVDKIRVIPYLTDIVRDQVLVIRADGGSNMLDALAVQQFAYAHNFYELINFIEEHRDLYAKFILTGERE
jgi:hypothetical protein